MRTPGVTSTRRCTERLPAEAVLTRAMTSEPASLDPHGPASSGLSLVLPYLFDTLVTRDVDNTLVPLLAESWETVRRRAVHHHEAEVRRDLPRRHAHECGSGQVLL